MGNAARRPGASRAGPLPLEGLRENSCPNAPSAAGKTRSSQYAVLAAADLRGGSDPGSLDKVAWWQTDDFWQYALFATVDHIRAAACRAGMPTRLACRDLAQRPGRPAP